MKTVSCDEVRESLPARARSTLEPGVAREIEAHIATCETCAAEAGTIALLLRHPVEIPDGLEWRIRRAVRGRRPLPWYRRNARPLALAATVAGVMLIGQELLDRDATVRPTTAPTTTAAPVSVGTDVFPGTDGVVAGSVVLPALTDQELRGLLEELGS